MLRSIDSFGIAALLNKKVLYPIFSQVSREKILPVPLFSLFSRLQKNHNKIEKNFSTLEFYFKSIYIYPLMTELFLTNRLLGHLGIGKINKEDAK